VFLATEKDVSHIGVILNDDPKFALGHIVSITEQTPSFLG
jgi:hypothetical protein